MKIAKFTETKNKFNFFRFKSWALGLRDDWGWGGTEWGLGAAGAGIYPLLIYLIHFQPFVLFSPSSISNLGRAPGHSEDWVWGGTGWGLGASGVGIYDLLIFFCLFQLVVFFFSSSCSSSRLGFVLSQVIRLRRYWVRSWCNMSWFIVYLIVLFEFRFVVIFPPCSFSGQALGYHVKRWQWGSDDNLGILDWICYIFDISFIFNFLSCFLLSKKF